MDTLEFHQKFLSKLDTTDGMLTVPSSLDFHPTQFLLKFSGKETSETSTSNTVSFDSQTKTEESQKRKKIFRIGVKEFMEYKKNVQAFTESKGFDKFDKSNELISLSIDDPAHTEDSTAMDLTPDAAQSTTLSLDLFRLLVGLYVSTTRLSLRRDTADDFGLFSNSTNSKISKPKSPGKNQEIDNEKGAFDDDELVKKRHKLNLITIRKMARLKMNILYSRMQNLEA